MEPRRVDPDFIANAGFWLAVGLLMLTVLIYIETWRTGQHLRRHSAGLEMLIAGVEHGGAGRTAEGATWRDRRDLAVAVEREKRRLRRLERIRAATTTLLVLGSALAVAVINSH